jgi:hypothetical protein
MWTGVNISLSPIVDIGMPNRHASIRKQVIISSGHHIWPGLQDYLLRTPGGQIGQHPVARRAIIRRSDIVIRVFLKRVVSSKRAKQLMALSLRLKARYMTS